MNEKKALRKKYLKIRSEIPELKRRHLSTWIQERAAGLVLANKARVISLYLSYLSEVETFKLASFCLAEKLQVWVPEVDYRQKKVYHAKLDNLARVTTDDKGVPVPDGGETAETVAFDIIFCPGVVFDRKGHRLGYGEGYYDRFLEAAEGAVRVGLCFSAQLVDELPAEPHDVRMDYIITENEILPCS